MAISKLILATQNLDPATAIGPSPVVEVSHTSVDVEVSTNELLVVMVSVVVLRFSLELLPCSLLVLEEMEPVAVIVVTVAVVIVSVIVEVLAVVAVVVVVAVVAVAAAVLVNAVLVVVLWVADVPVVVMLRLAVLMVLVVALVLVVVLVTVLVPLVLLDVVGSCSNTKDVGIGTAALLSDCQFSVPWILVSSS